MVVRDLYTLRLSMLLEKSTESLRSVEAAPPQYAKQWEIRHWTIQMPLEPQGSQTSVFRVVVSQFQNEILGTCKARVSLGWLFKPQQEELPCSTLGYRELASRMLLVNCYFRVKWPATRWHMGGKLVTSLGPVQEPDVMVEIPPKPLLPSLSKPWSISESPRHDGPSPRDAQDLTQDI